MINFNKRKALANTKTPIVITVMVIIIAIIALQGIKQYKLKLLNLAYENTIIKLQDATTASLVIWPDYFHSPLFSETELTDYSLKPGKFLQEIVGVSKYCGNSNGDCFAKKYTYENGQPYTPTFKGSCATLKNGPSICMIPQVKNNDITGIIDVNGTEAPNVYGKDLRTFEIKAKKRNYNPEEDDKVGDVYVVAP